jgi:hypothetical protein
VSSMRLTSLTSKWFSLAIAILGASARSPPVKLALRSSWPAPPLLLEIMFVSKLPHSPKPVNERVTLQ